MLLAIDIGNTNIVLGLYQGKKLITHWRLATQAERTADEYGVIISQLIDYSGHRSQQITAIAVSCVVPPMVTMTEELGQKFFHIDPLIVGPGVKTGMPILYESPKDVGADRIVNGIAAYDKYRDDCIIVDFGTATTIDLISKKGEYIVSRHHSDFSMLDECEILVAPDLATGNVKLDLLAANTTRNVDCGSVGFRLAPRLNAAGRLEDATLGVELLLCGDPAKACAIAEELDASNVMRQSLEQAMLRDVLDLVKASPDLRGRKSIVLASEKWHPGVVGIVASRIVDLYHRPTILISLQDGSGKGSGRSIPNFHLHDALKACSEHLLKFGGHKYAAGLSIDESTLEAFVDLGDKGRYGYKLAADIPAHTADLANGQLLYNAGGCRSCRAGRSRHAAGPRPERLLRLPG